MSEKELSILLAGYVDGELDEAQRAQVESALENDPALREELDEMRRLKELTTGLGEPEAADGELDAFWNDVYNRLERHTAWILLVAGLVLLAAGVLVLFFRDPDTPWLLKVAVGSTVSGALLLTWSVWRERSRVLRHDRYSREVHR